MMRREIFKSFLEQGMTAGFLDARHPQVLVPDIHKTDYALRLNFSYDFKGSVCHINDFGVAQTLTFASIPFDVFVPWEAFHGLMVVKTGGGLVFTESLPPELRQPLDAAAPESDEEARQKMTAKAAAELIAVTPKPNAVEVLRDAIGRAPDGFFDSAPPPRPKLMLIKGGKS